MKPTTVRYQVIGTTALVAVLLYFDRVCIAEIVKRNDFKSALGLSPEDTSAMLAAFFLSYALAQVPSGWLADRWGARGMMPFYVIVWSLCTMATGLATTIGTLLAARLLFGIAQAGCYPTASSLLRRWVPQRQRGIASSVVTFGGRLGGAVSPLITAWLLKDVFDWRQTLTLYGVAGLLVAAIYWFVVRERPADHPRCNDAERLFVVQDVAAESLNSPPAPFPPLLPLMTSRTMWLISIVQFGVNVGWVFLVTWLPTYLKEAKQVEDERIGGLMGTIALSAGIAGTLAGGPLTDFAVRRWGKRWGRTAPMVVCYAIAFGAYQACPYLKSPWAFVGAVSLSAFVSDLGIPAIWAFMQDVGGANTAAAFGWGNMWGNLGAAVAAYLVPTVLKAWDANGDWHEAFYLFSAGYALALAAAIGLDANRAIE